MTIASRASQLPGIHIPSFRLWSSSTSPLNRVSTAQLLLLVLESSAMDRAETCRQMQGILRGPLPAFVRALCSAGASALSEEDDMDWTKDPEKVEYIRQLVEALLEARAIVSCYSIVILLIILVLAVQHWQEARSDRRKWQRLTQGHQDVAADGMRTPSSSTASSSSSTLTGTATPPDAKDLDIERVPLLADRRRTAPRKSVQAAVGMAVRSWLTQQPAPMPFVNKTLPSNGMSLFILAWLGLNIFFHFFCLPMRWDFFFIFADRAGCVFVVNLPLLYLLGAKNQPLRRLTGYSYEALNIFHRRVGELMCFEAAVHFVSMLLWQFLLARPWLTERSAYTYFTHPIILCGIGAFTAYELLYFTSLASFRQRWYELFLASHVLLQTLALPLLWFHYHTARPYAAAALLIFIIDRLVWRLNLNHTRLTADLTPLDAHTFLLSADWSIPTTRRGSRSNSILHGWAPTAHVFLTVPALSRFQAHPFTIASAAPLPLPTTTADAGDETQPERHAWFSLLIRAQSGFTRDLLRLAHAHPAAARRIEVCVDGPYGSTHALALARATGATVLVAGGSGIAVVWGLAWALLREEESTPSAFVREGGGVGDGKDETERRRRRRMRKVYLLWVTHSREHREWVPGAQLEELVERGLELVVPEPTAEAGRPDVMGVVGGWIEEAAVEGREVGVVVSGPDGLNRVVRNACAEEIGRGREVRVAVEKFGW